MNVVESRLSRIMTGEMSEQEGISYSFNRLVWLRKTRYLTRQILFLDLNHWINLAEEQDNVSRELNKALHEAVDAGKLVCLVSPSLLMEVEKRPLSDMRYRYCRLRDRLSGKLSLRDELAIFAEEFRARGLRQQIERQIAYSFSMRCLPGRDWSFLKVGPRNWRSKQRD